MDYPGLRPLKVVVEYVVVLVVAVHNTTWKKVIPTKLMAKNAFLQKSLGKYSLKILWEIFLIFCILPADPLSIFKGQNPVVPSYIVGWGSFRSFWEILTKEKKNS